MRQGQQHIRRGRGRNNNHGGHNNNNNHRKNQNPLTRSFESNGPDVKIRGNPMHIAEKYVQLARDAQSSGDPVLAENYLQHAEHYNRIIMAHRDSMAHQSSDGGGQFQRRAPFAGETGDALEDGAEEAMDDGLVDAGVTRLQTPRGHEPQPSIDTGFGGTGSDQPQHPPRQMRDTRHEPRDGRNPDGRQGQHRRPFRDRFGSDNRGPDMRQQSGDRMASDRGGLDRPGAERVSPERPGIERNGYEPSAAGNGSAPSHHEPRTFRSQPIDRDPPAGGEREEPRGERREPRPERHRRGDRSPIAGGESGFDAQPDFLRRPVRRPRRDAAPEGEASGSSAVTDEPGTTDKTLL